MKFSQTSFSKAISQRVAVEFRQTPLYHTFFLPKRERKYQRKRFRAAARTPRGHRGCSALSALEMKHSRRLCGDRRTFLAVAASLCQRRQRERGLWRTVSLHPYPKTYYIKMSAAVRKPFSLIFVSKKQKLKLSQGGEDSTSPRQLRRLRWCLREIQPNIIF